MEHRFALYRIRHKPNASACNEVSAVGSCLFHSVLIQNERTTDLGQSRVHPLPASTFGTSVLLLLFVNWSEQQSLGVFVCAVAGAQHDRQSTWSAKRVDTCDALGVR